MVNEDRAKQFLAFEALRGLREELRKKEIEIEEKSSKENDNIDKFIYKEKEK